MKHLEYTIDISVPAEKVWNIMLNEQSYQQWVATAWPNSSYKGKWEQGTEISFLSPGEGGIKARLDIVKPYEHVLATHIALVDKDGNEERSAERSNGLIGTREEYRFKEVNGKTTLTVSIETDPAWTEMFNDGWPTALQDLKNMCEEQSVAA